jgi:hypothetical protein
MKNSMSEALEIWFLFMRLQVSIADCELLAQQSRQGGAVYAAESCSLAVRGSTFVSKNASYGGALVADDLSTVFVTSSAFDSNTAEMNAGAVHANVHAQVGLQEAGH